MSASGDDWIARLNRLSDVEQESLQSAVTKLVIAPVAAFFLGLASSVEAVLDLIILPVEALGINAAGFVESVIGGASGIVDAGAAMSASEVSIFGILSFPAGIAIAGLGSLVLAWFLQRRATGDTFLFGGIDIPTDVIGSDEDEG
jgi:hypothetical protein